MSDSGRRPEDDPRFQRVRSKLHETILDLAAENTAESLAVGQITNAAGVHRTSFYSHAASPAALLVDALADDLSPRLDQVFSNLETNNLDFADYWQDFYREVLTHVEKYVNVYRLIIQKDSAVVGGLRAYFEEEATVAMRQIMPAWDGEQLSELWLEMALQQQVYNLVAVVAAWVKMDPLPSIDEVVDVYWTLAPPWQLARADDSGRVHMRRRGQG